MISACTLPELKTFAESDLNGSFEVGSTDCNLDPVSATEPVGKECSALPRTMQQMHNNPSEPMDPQAEAQLLVGMPPTGWKYPPSTATAGATYLRRHIGAGEGSLDLEVWQRLAAHEQAGRLALRLRAPFHAMHAKLYLWQTAAGHWQGVSGSSNLTHSGLTGPGELNTILTAEPVHWTSSWFQTHWHAPPSRLASQVWAELAADGQAETEAEIIEEGEVIVPASGVPARRGLAAAAFEGRLWTKEYRVYWAVLLLVIGALVGCRSRAHDPGRYLAARRAPLVGATQNRIRRPHSRSSCHRDQDVQRIWAAAVPQKQPSGYGQSGIWGLLYRSMSKLTF